MPDPSPLNVDSLKLLQLGRSGGR